MLAGWLLIPDAQPPDAPYAALTNAVIEPIRGLFFPLLVIGSLVLLGIRTVEIYQRNKRRLYDLP